MRGGGEVVRRGAARVFGWDVSSVVLMCGSLGSFLDTRRFDQRCSQRKPQVSGNCSSTSRNINRLCFSGHLAAHLA